MLHFAELKFCKHPKILQNVRPLQARFLSTPVRVTAVLSEELDRKFISEKLPQGYSLSHLGFSFRHGDKSVHARSVVTVKGLTADQKKAYLDAIEQTFQDQLQKKGRFADITSVRAYEWNLAVDKGDEVIFNVNWYDPVFYAEKSEAHQNAFHKHVFTQLGVQIDNIVVDNTVYGQ